MATGGSHRDGHCTSRGASAARARAQGGEPSSLSTETANGARQLSQTACARAGLRGRSITRCRPADSRGLAGVCDEGGSLVERCDALSELKPCPHLACISRENLSGSHFAQRTASPRGLVAGPVVRATQPMATHLHPTKLHVSHCGLLRRPSTIFANPHRLQADVLAVRADVQGPVPAVHSRPAA